MGACQERLHAVNQCWPGQTDACCAAETMMIASNGQRWLTTRKWKTGEAQMEHFSMLEGTEAAEHERTQYKEDW